MSGTLSVKELIKELVDYDMYKSVKILTISGEEKIHEIYDIYLDDKNVIIRVKEQ